MSRGVSLVALALLAAVAVPAAATPDPARLVDDAIAVHGGAARLAALPDLELTGTYESGRWGDGARWELRRQERGDGAFRAEVSFEMRGSQRTAVEIYDGDRLHKSRFGTAWDDVPLDEVREWAAHRLPFLLAARARGPELVGDGDEGGVAVWRVAVADGRGRALLSLAKDDRRLVALEYPGTEASGMGEKKEVTRTLRFADFRPVAGLLLPFSVEVRQAGSLEHHARYSEITVLDAFPAEWVRVPNPARALIPPEELAY